MIDRKELQLQSKASLINRIVEMSNAIAELEEMVSRLESERNRNKHLPQNYNGKTAEEWYTLYCQQTT